MKYVEYLLYISFLCCSRDCRNCRESFCILVLKEVLHRICRWPVYRNIFSASVLVPFLFGFETLNWHLDWGLGFGIWDLDLG